MHNANQFLNLDMRSALDAAQMMGWDWKKWLTMTSMQRGDKYEFKESFEQGVVLIVPRRKKSHER